MHALEPYPSYHESGVPWLGQVPAHWEVTRANRRLKLANCPISPSELSNQRIVHYSIPNVQQFGKGIVEAGSSIDSAKNLISRTLLLVSKLNPRMGTIALAEPDQELVTLASGEFVAMEPTRCAGAFARYLYMSELVRQQLSSRVESATKSHQRCSPEDITKLWVAWPPFPEQAAIVRFLDHADRRIRRCIRAKEMVIALLEEQKQAIIHQAVTGRIDIRTGRPYPAYKPSGVEWLGDVPEHWEARRLKTVCRIRYGLGQPPPELTNGLPLIRATNVSRGRIVDEHLLYVDPSGVPASREAILKEGEIIVVRSGAYTADSAIVPRAYAGAVAGYDMVATVVAALPKFIAAALLSSYLRDDQLIVESTRSAQPHLNAEELGSAVLLLPPRLEQRSIVDHLGRMTAANDSEVANSNRQIDLLREYRTRLISDVVTGKLDVREAAAALPEEPDEPDAAGGNGAGVEKGDDGRAGGGWRTEARATRMEMTS